MTKVYILIESCCNHYYNAFKTYDEAVHSQFESVEEMENEGYHIVEKTFT
jgi:hypothetical protein